MKKITIVEFVALTICMIFCCSCKEQKKEIKITHEHFIYNADQNEHCFCICKHNKYNKLNSSKGGIDPRYDHKPGQGKPIENLGNDKSGIDSKCDHKTEDTTKIDGSVLKED